MPSFLGDVGRICSSHFAENPLTFVCVFFRETSRNVAQDTTVHLARWRPPRCVSKSGRRQVQSISSELSVLAETQTTLGLAAGGFS